MTSRRDILKLGAAGAALTHSLFANALARALATPANRRTGTIEDVEHIVILMQENRSFDHYFGTMAGVRGFGDPVPPILPGGAPTWFQPTAEGGIARPFLFDSVNTNFPIMKSLPHDRKTGQEAWNEGRYDRWIASKGPLTMGYLDRAALPFHFALADAFTVCDAYYSSFHGPTCPNRLYMMTGSNDPSGRSGGPAVIDNDNATQLPNGKRIYGPGWVTYPERLERAGIRWQTYRQGVDPRSDWDSDGGMNLLPAFETFLAAKPGEPLYERGMRPRRLDQLKEDVQRGTLAQVSWIFPPRNFCEHPKYPPIYGMEYIARILDALSCNPAIWSKTAFILTYDENDGFFDHLQPPVAPLGVAQGASNIDVTGEHGVDAQPHGPGPRVPTLVISPWSRGGHVCSDAFDHTSLVRFIEARFGVPAPDVTPWRREIFGDLTTAFDFDEAPTQFPRQLSLVDAVIPLPEQSVFEAYRAVFKQKPKPVAPADPNTPQVEGGTRPKRASSYRLAVRARRVGEGVEIDFVNTGRLGALFFLHDLTRSDAAPLRFGVRRGSMLRHVARFDSKIALRIEGPDGFVRIVSANGPADPLRVNAIERG